MKRLEPPADLLLPCSISSSTSVSIGEEWPFPDSPPECEVGGRAEAAGRAVEGEEPFSLVDGVDGVQGAGVGVGLAGCEV